MIYNEIIEIKCSISSLFILSTHLVLQECGDGDCTVISNITKRLVHNYKKSLFIPKHWNNVGTMFGHGQEWLIFADTIDDALGYTYVIDWKGE